MEQPKQPKQAKSSKIFWTPSEWNQVAEKAAELMTKGGEGLSANLLDKAQKVLKSKRRRPYHSLHGAVVQVRDLAADLGVNSSPRVTFMVPKQPVKLSSDLEEMIREAAAQAAEEFLDANPNIMTEAIMGAVRRRVAVGTPAMAQLHQLGQEPGEQIGPGYFIIFGLNEEDAVFIAETYDQDLVRTYSTAKGFLTAARGARSNGIVLVSTVLPENLAKAVESAEDSEKVDVVLFQDLNELVKQLDHLIKIQAASA